LNDFARQLCEEAASHLAAGHTEVAVIGLSSEAIEVAAALETLGGHARLFDPDDPDGSHPALEAWAELGSSDLSLVIISSDERKEELLRAAADVLDSKNPLPQVVLAGLSHQEVHDDLFDELEAPALVSSYATGHPHTRRHLYDCLRSAAAAGRRGAVVELGAFKGGTSVWLAKAIAGLGLSECPVIAFDAWDGFPPRRSLLDLYEHPRCVFRDLEAVRAYTKPHGIELVVGDIRETAPGRLADESVLLAFIDTDNYSGTRAALEPILANLVKGGAIIFDHYYTTSDYPYTVGERIAAEEVLKDAGLLHLHGTGVFVNLS
jgi:O-methyltransferase